MIRTATSRWSGVVLVCGKCSRKIGGGFGPKGRTSLAKELRRRAGKGRKASAGVIETRCLTLCPKNAVAVVDGRHPDRWLAVSPDEPLSSLAERLGLVDARN